MIKHVVGRVDAMQNHQIADLSTEVPHKFRWLAEYDPGEWFAARLKIGGMTLEIVIERHDAPSLRGRESDLLFVRQATAARLVRGQTIGARLRRAATTKFRWCSSKKYRTLSAIAAFLQDALKFGRKSRPVLLGRFLGMPNLFRNLLAVVQVVRDGRVNVGKRDRRIVRRNFLGAIPASWSILMSMTRMRCPAMHALPPQTPGVFVMCSVLMDTMTTPLPIAAPALRCAKPPRRG